MKKFYSKLVNLIGVFLLCFSSYLFVHSSNLFAADNPLDTVFEGIFQLFDVCVSAACEVPQALCSMVLDVFSEDLEDNNKMKVCSSPLVLNGISLPGEHVYIRSYCGGILNNVIEYGGEGMGSMEELLCGENVAGWFDISITDPNEPFYPQETCHAIDNHTIHDPYEEDGYNWITENNIGELNDCKRAELLHCISSELKEHFTGVYSFLGQNCGDMGDFLLACAGLRPTVQFNGDFCNVGIYNEGFLIDAGGYVLDRGNFAIPIFGQISAPDACRAVRTNCKPCPEGMIFNPDVGECICYTGGSFDESQYPNGDYCKCDYNSGTFDEIGSPIIDSYSGLNMEDIPVDYYFGEFGEDGEIINSPPGCYCEYEPENFPPEPPIDDNDEVLANWIYHSGHPLDNLDEGLSYRYCQCPSPFSWNKDTEQCQCSESSHWVAPPAGPDGEGWCCHGIMEWNFDEEGCTCPENYYHVEHECNYCCPEGTVCDYDENDPFAQGECVCPNPTDNYFEDCGCCPEDTVCDPATGGCIEPPCVDNIDCPSGEVCEEGSCIPDSLNECVFDFECAFGMICEDGICVIPKNNGNGGGFNNNGGSCWNGQGNCPTTCQFGDGFCLCLCE